MYKPIICILFLSLLSATAADFEWNSQGIIDYPAYMFGTSINWGEYHITVLENDTGSDLTITELGFSCSGPGPAEWLVWTDVTGFAPPEDPDSAEHSGTFTPLDPNPYHTPDVYTDVNVSGEGIVFANGSLLCFGYENPGSGGFSELAGPHETWSWFNNTWDGDSQHMTTNCTQILANYASSLSTTTFAGIKASFQ